MQIDNKLKKLMEIKGISQKELAEKIGLTISTLSRYMNGNRIPKSEHLIKIAQALNVTVEELTYDNNISNDKIIKKLITEKEKLVNRCHNLIKTIKSLIPLINKLNRQNDTVQEIKEKCQEAIKNIQ